MKRLLIFGFAVAAGALVLAGCGGGGSRNVAPSAGQATVSSKQLGDAGKVLVNSSGKALYTNNREMGGNVACDGACLSFWTPLTVHGKPNAGSISGKLGEVKRPDGTEQVTFNGKPLYSFAEDKPGQVSGDGFTDAFGGTHFTWHVVHSTGAASSPGGSQNNGNGFPGY